tara:strand:- start:59 stop:220 length:162 start_codon:yes stop_codon:yes gene_type:complete
VDLIFIIKLNFSSVLGHLFSFYYKAEQVPFYLKFYLKFLNKNQPNNVNETNDL